MKIPHSFAFILLISLSNASEAQNCPEGMFEVDNMGNHTDKIAAPLIVSVKPDSIIVFLASQTPVPLIRFKILEADCLDTVYKNGIVRFTVLDLDKQPTSKNMINIKKGEYLEILYEGYEPRVLYFTRNRQSAPNNTP